MGVVYPHTKRQKEELEKVQKTAARFITNNYHYTTGSTKANMQQLGWIPLEEHRARIKSTILYKARHKLVDLPIENFPINKHSINTRHNKRQNYNIPTSNIDNHLYSFFPNSIRLWNSIPDSIRHSHDVDTFRHSLNNITLRTQY